MEKSCELDSGVTLCYETFGHDGAAPMLLIMGLGTQMIAWPERFCEELADRGHYVIRFDNRDCGRSSRMPGRPPSMREIVLRRVQDPPYTLSDMAADAVGLLAHLGIDSAHVVGASMGGMIAQTLAIEHPPLVRSLVSIMSSTGGRWSGQPRPTVMRYLLSRAPTEREAYIEHMMRIYDAIGSTGLQRDLDRLRATAARSYERGINPAGTARQLGAIIAAGDRTAALRKLDVTTLVIHGSRDPLVQLSGGRATARAIPRARLMVVDGMGHDLPDEVWPQLIDGIAGHAQAAEDASPASREELARSSR